MDSSRTEMRTVAGVFPDHARAVAATQELYRAGIDPEKVKLCDAHGNMTPDNRQDEGRGDQRSFLGRLFGLDDEQHGRYNADRQRFAADEDYFSSLATGNEEVVLVQATGQAEIVADLLQRNGGRIEVEAGSRFDETREEVDKLILREEKLVPETEVASAGELRVRKEVVSDTQTMEVPLEREEVVIERRDLTPGEASAEKAPGTISSEMLSPGEEIRVPVSEDKLRVEKKTVPREEIVVGKRKTSKTERVSGQVKREEARIESEGQINVQNRHGRRPADQEQPRP